MHSYVLDASALLALINEEKGFEKVAEFLPKSIMSAVNFSECISVLASIGIPEQDIKYTLKELLGTIIDFDREQAYMTAFLREHTKKFGLSLGDRACIALAKLKQIPVVTADKIWSQINCGVEVILIR
jgi:ribonuclease VapC